MSRRFSKVVPKSDLELERFYLDTINKLQDTTATLEEVDQRSTWPGASVTSELERLIYDIAKRVAAPLKAQISELERQLRNSQGLSLSTKLDDLERRINSIERSARF